MTQRTTRTITRRHFIVACAGIAAAGGCRSASKPEAEAPADPCSDTRGLSDDDARARAAVNYVGESPFSDMRCDNCQFWLTPAEGAPCGGCVIVKGPIHPRGHCTSWAPPAA